MLVRLDSASVSPEVNSGDIEKTLKLANLTELNCPRAFSSTRHQAGYARASQRPQDTLSPFSCN